ncbi:hypothetical protein BGZ63DRAFT_156375 [Mariannaea sp. PMI_226]|nr:hypothetical protein BGZ63DRAFT_156375 [Mariannaea sp. PMI_226]
MCFSGSNWLLSDLTTSRMPPSWVIVHPSSPSLPLPPPSLQAQIDHPLHDTPMGHHSHGTPIFPSSQGPRAPRHAPLCSPPCPHLENPKLLIQHPVSFRASSSSATPSSSSSSTVPAFPFHPRLSSPFSSSFLPLFPRLHTIVATPRLLSLLPLHRSSSTLSV